MEFQNLFFLYLKIDHGNPDPQVRYYIPCKHLILIGIMLKYISHKSHNLHKILKFNKILSFGIHRFHNKYGHLHTKKIALGNQIGGIQTLGISNKFNIYPSNK